MLGLKQKNTPVGPPVGPTEHGCMFGFNPTYLRVQLLVFLSRASGVCMTEELYPAIMFPLHLFSKVVLCLCLVTCDCRGGGSSNLWPFFFIYLCSKHALQPKSVIFHAKHSCRCPKLLHHTTTPTQSVCRFSSAEWCVVSLSWSNFASCSLCVTSCLSVTLTQKPPFWL